MIPTNKLWKITYIGTSNAGALPQWARKTNKLVADIVAPTKRLAILNFRDQIGWFEILTVGVRRAIKARPMTVDVPRDRTVYRLTGGPLVLCIANGNTWADSEVPPEDT